VHSSSREGVALNKDMAIKFNIQLWSSMCLLYKLLFVYFVVNLVDKQILLLHIFDW
jgi:hypothetical protein